MENGENDVSGTTLTECNEIKYLGHIIAYAIMSGCALRRSRSHSSKYPVHLWCHKKQGSRRKLMVTV